VIDTNQLVETEMHDKKRSYQILSLGILTVFSVVMYLFRPMEVSMPFNYVCFTLFLLSTILYFSLKKKTNFFDFDSIFILLLAVIGFAYSVFIYDESEPFNIAFSLSFDIKFIPTGTILFVIGFQSYFWGSIAVSERKLIEKALDTKKMEPVNNTALSIIVILLSIGFLLAGGVQYYRSIYYFKNTETASGMVLQMMSLLHAFSITAIATEFYNKLIDKKHLISPVLVLAISIVILLMLYAGNRTLASQLALPIIGLYALYFKDIGKFQFLLFIFVGTILMWLIQSTRVGLEVEAAQKGSEIISDLTIPTRSTYSSMEYVEQFGHTWGQNLLGGLIAAVPSLERFLVIFTGLNSRSLWSAEFLTDYTLGPDPYVGLGTNLIADLFLSFDIFGVIILLFLLGYFVNWSQYNARLKNYYSLVVYASLMSYSAFLARSSYTHPFRLILWSFIIALINKSISQKLFTKSE